MSTEQQAAFDAANAQSYAHFPAGTRVGRLLETTFAGKRYELLGFRDGASLCLRLVGPSTAPLPTAACVPRRELTDLGQSAAALDAADTFYDGSEPTAIAVYGVAADSVDAVQIETASGDRHPATLTNNAFLYLATGHRRLPEPVGADAIRVLVHEQGGETMSVPLDTGLHGPDLPDPADLPGPAEMDRTLEPSHVSWLEHAEPRGEPCDWPDGSRQRLRGADPLERAYEARRIRRPAPRGRDPHLLRRANSRGGAASY